MRELMTSQSFELSDDTWETMTETLLTEHFQYGRQALYPVINCIMTDLQTICEIYRSHSDTCVNLLEQAMMSFTKNDYEQMVIAAIEAHCDEEPALWPLVDSLRNLRKYIGDYPSDLAKPFHREIALLPGEQKTQQFSELVESICRTATQQTVDNINQQKLSMRMQTLSM